MYRLPRGWLILDCLLLAESFSIAAVRFGIEGETLTIQFSGPTLRGGEPMDANGDDIPDYVNYDKAKHVGTTFDCDEIVYPGYTIGVDAQCVWQSDSLLVVTIGAAADPDLGASVCVRQVYGAWTSGSSDSALPTHGCRVLEEPYPLHPPAIQVTGAETSCYPSAFTLDATSSSNLGGRPTFAWSLSGKPLDLSGSSTRVFESNKLQDMGVEFNYATHYNQRSVRLSAGVLEADTAYTVRLAVTSRWLETSEKLVTLSTSCDGNGGEQVSAADTTTSVGEKDTNYYSLPSNSEASDETGTTYAMLIRASLATRQMSFAVSTTIAAALAFELG